MISTRCKSSRIAHFFVLARLEKQLYINLKAGIHVRLNEGQYEKCQMRVIRRDGGSHIELLTFFVYYFLS